MRRVCLHLRTKSNCVSYEERRVVDQRDIILSLERLSHAHDAHGWTFPLVDSRPSATRSEDFETRTAGIWHARGDVAAEDVKLIFGNATGTQWKRDELFRKWSTGDVLLAPWVPPLVFADKLPEIQEWEIAPGLRMLPLRTPTLPPASYTNSFLVGDSDLVLIEPAPHEPAQQEILLSWIRQAQDAGLRPIAIAITHHHHDHIGNLDIARRLGLPLWAHLETANRLDVAIDRYLVDGDTINLGSIRLQVVHTPGHAPGHLCFFEPRSSTFIVGDMVAGTGTILIDPRDGNMSQYLASLRRILSFDAKKLLPAHGGIIAEPKAWITRYIDHRLAREQDILFALSGSKSLDLSQLLESVYHDVPTHIWSLAALSLRAHLDKLVSENRAVYIDRDRWSLRS